MAKQVQRYVDNEDQRTVIKMSRSQIKEDRRVYMNRYAKGRNRAILLLMVLIQEITLYFNFGNKYLTLLLWHLYLRVPDMKSFRYERGA